MSINCLNSDEILVIAEIEAISNILQLSTKLSGMRFVAIYHTMETHWIACTVYGELKLRARTENKLEIEEIFCNELRKYPTPTIISSVRAHPSYFEIDPNKKYGFESYISLPIVLLDGSFFGSLCLLDSQARKLDDPPLLEMLTGITRLFSIVMSAHKKIGSLAHTKLHLS